MFSRPLTCPCCKQSLVIHQPDSQNPDRLLGTCSHCSTWALLDVGAKGKISLTVFPKTPVPVTSRTILLHH